MPFTPPVEAFQIYVTQAAFDEIKDKVILAGHPTMYLTIGSAQYIKTTEVILRRGAV